MLALVDCDAFFCSCERLFREDLRHRPVIVLSNNDGCAISRTREAKALGIEMGAPYFQIRELCERHKVSVFSSNFSLYTNISARITTTLRRLVPKIEVYSVDEAFLDLTGMNDLENFCRGIQKTIQGHIGIPVSVGIGPTKGLCKAACFLAKRDLAHGGVVSLEERGKQDQVLALMPLEKIWGIAKGRALKLWLAGIKNAKDFRDYNNDQHIQAILTKVGRQIQDELRGIVSFPLQEGGEKKKEIMSSRTFGHGVFDKRTLMESIATHASEVAQELRKQKSVCMSVSIFVRSEWDAASTSCCFQTPTNNTFKIIKAALRCLDSIYVYGVEYQKSGVSVFSLQDEDEHTLGLFEGCDSHHQRVLMETMDRINLREGERILVSMSCGVDNREWRMRRNFKSPRYTTSWEELPKCL
ncbi:MAG: Y-family DNA polymerase [Bdellovibrionota bacterium]